MPTHLTRQVFRKLIANEPLVFRGCIRRQAYTTLRSSHERLLRSRVQNVSSRSSRKEQRRTFFDLFVSQKVTTPRAPVIVPGIDVLAHYAKMKRLNARLPPANEVALAVANFCEHKFSHGHQIQDAEAHMLLQSLQYCADAVGDLQSDLATMPRLMLAIFEGSIALKNSRERASAVHLNLARAFLDFAIANKDVEKGYRSKSFKDRGSYRLQPAKRLKKIRTVYTLFLSLLGEAPEVRSLALACSKDREALRSKEHGTASSREVLENDDDQDVDPDGQGASGKPNLEVARGSHDERIIWSHAVSAYARRDSEAELLSTLEMMSQCGIQVEQAIASAMLTFYLRQNNPSKIKEWWGKRQETRDEVHALTDTVDCNNYSADLHRVLQWCLENKELEYGHELVRQAANSDPSYSVRNVILAFAAGCGKSAEEIDRMIDVLSKYRKNIVDEKQSNYPTAETINRLVETAVAQDNPYLAERFLALGKQRDIAPDAMTYILQMQYRLKVHDLDGALTAYKGLQSTDLTKDTDIPVVNSLLAALCRSKVHDFDTIMNVAADLSDRRAQFEADTVAALSILHLDRDEKFDVIDLLNTHAHHFSLNDRAHIRKTLVEYIQDSATETPRAWDAYTILRENFDEIAREERTRVFLAFFAKERPDMAVHVFNAMRHHSRTDTQPTADTYIVFFLTAAKYHDLESVEVVHNQLKLDYTINVDTRLNNALMIAFNSCGNPRRALTFWNEITASVEGPSYNSIHLALRACERSVGGVQKAKQIWARLQKLNIDLDQRLWSSYIASLVGVGATEETAVADAITTAEQALERDDLEVDAFLVASMFNAAFGDVRKEEIKNWAVEKYPDVWKEVEGLGIELEEGGFMHVKGIDRSVSP